MKIGSDWTAAGSPARLKVGLTASVLLALPAVALPGPWMWFFMAPLLWGIRGVGWKGRAWATAVWGGTLLILICYPLLHIDPRAFFYAAFFWLSFYFLLGSLLIPWGRVEGSHPLVMVISPAVVWLGLSRIYASIVPPGDFWMVPAAGAPWPGEVVSLIGAWGLSAIMLTASSAIALLATRFRRSGVRTLGALGFLVIVLVLVAPRPDPADEHPVTISLLQGDFALQWEERAALLDTLVLPTYLELYKDRAPSSDLVVAPEYALAVVLEDRPDIVETVQAAVDSFGTAFLIGAEGRLEGEPDRYYNMAWMFRPGRPLEGAPAPYPVPYTLHETVPGPGPPSFSTPIQMGILLCFDITIHSLCQELARSNRLLVMMSNLQGFDRSMTTRFMKGTARLRAAETGCFIAVAANTGPTGMISPLGKELGWAGKGRHTIQGTIRLTDGPAWYVLYGNRVLWAAWMIGFAFCAWNERSRYRKRGRRDAGKQR